MDESKIKSDDTSNQYPTLGDIDRRIAGGILNDDLDDLIVEAVKNPDLSEEQKDEIRGRRGKGS